MEPSSTTTTSRSGQSLASALATVRTITGSSLYAATSTDTPGRYAGSKVARRARRSATTASGMMTATRANARPIASAKPSARSVSKT